MEAGAKPGQVLKNVGIICYSHNRPTELEITRYEDTKPISVEVRASELKCWRSVEDVLQGEMSTCLFMKYPHPTCVLENSVLTCQY